MEKKNYVQSSSETKGENSYLILRLIRNFDLQRPGWLILNKNRPRFYRSPWQI